MQFQKNILNSATRVALLISISNLCGLTWFSLIKYPDTQFAIVFALFSSVVSGLLGFFIGKSSQQGMPATTQSNNVEKMNVEKADVSVKKDNTNPNGEI